MLILRHWTKDKNPYADRYFEWHLGEKFPADLGRVVEFQVDGDELTLFIQAMHATRNPVQGISYSKQGGFTNGPL